MEGSHLSLLKQFANKKHWILGSLFVIAFITLRLYYLLVIAPNALNPDETAILVNARFLVEFGQDEWGKSWPIVFRSFGDAKLPGYIYLVAALGRVVGWSSWIVRIPSFVAGFILPLALWAWVKNVFRSSAIAWWSVLWLVLSPWSWHYSTIGFEAHLGLTVLIAALAVLSWQPFTWQKDLLAGALLLLAGLTYNTPWLLLPFLLGAVWITRWRQPLSSKLRPTILFLVVFLSIGWLTLSATSQKGAITVFQDPTVQHYYPEYRAGFTSPVMQKILGNQYVYFAQIIGLNWLRSWHPDFLTNLGGANPWHSIPGVGHLHPGALMAALWGVVCLFLQLVKEIKKRQLSKRILRNSALLWLLIASLAPAVVTVDAPHATRSLFFFVLLALFAGVVSPLLWQRFQLFSGAWRAVNISFFLLFVIWGWLWWFSPARVRWQFMVSPKWNTGLAEAAQQPTVQTAGQVAFWDPEGVRYVYVLQQYPEWQDEFFTTVQRSDPDPAGIVRVESFGKFQFVFNSDDAINSKADVYLQPLGNTQWDIIDL